MVKEYITWTRKFNGNQTWLDPSYESNIQWNGIVKMTETGYGNIDTDKRFLGIIEYDESFTKINRYISNYSSYSFVRITVDKALELCNEWYGDGMITLSEDGFTLVDNRVIEE